MANVSIYGAGPYGAGLYSKYRNFFWKPVTCSNTVWVIKACENSTWTVVK